MKLCPTKSIDYRNNYNRYTYNINQMFIYFDILLTTTFLLVFILLYTKSFVYELLTLQITLKQIYIYL